MQLKHLVAGRRGPVLISTLILLTVTGGGGAVAAGLVTSRQILDHTIRNVDPGFSSVGSNSIRNGSVRRRDLAFEVRNGAPGETGAAGADGAPGPRGATGSPGADGLTGAQGEVGETGANGEAGEQGLQGDAGAAGPDGASAYQVYVASVEDPDEPMTRAQWLASFEGDRGEQGIQGQSGPAR